MGKNRNNGKVPGKDEGYDTVKTDLPSNRFPSEKKVIHPDEMGVTQSSIPGTEDLVTTSNIKDVKAKKLKSKIKIRPDVSVEELNNTQVGGVSLASSPGMMCVAGVSSMSPVDDTSRTPYTSGGYRPSTRYGKKRSEDLFELDNTISEQVVPIVEDSLDLRESPESKQGYNGRKQFTQVRAKKNAVSTVNPRVPQQLLNDASLDFITTSKKIYTTGQVINNVDEQADYPTVKLSGQPVSYVMKKSNYHPTHLKFKIEGGRITDVSITEHKVNVEADPVSRDQANLNWQVDANNVAKSMIRLQAELGRETTDKWSPLGYVIHEPYQYNMLMHDIEATTGAIMGLAYRSAVSSLAFQRNILAKDGVNPQRNAVKMILEGYAGRLASSNSATLSNNNFSEVIWNKGAYRKGSPAAIIDIFDSTNKYSTKADFLGMPRSFQLHMSQAIHNIEPLRAKPEFFKALDKAHMFSTIDGGYNPMLPIFTTETIKVINPLSLNAFLINWKNPALLTAQERLDPMRDCQTGTYAIWAYSYKDIRNEYHTRVQHPLIEGILKWLLKHEGSIVRTYGEGEVSIPFVFNMQSPSMMSFLLCSASQEVLRQRNICFRDILFAGDQENYIWDDLQTLKDIDPLKSTQMTIGGYDEPLKLGKLSSDTVVRELWGTHMQLADYQSGALTKARAQYFAPWYMNEVAFTNSYTSNEGFFDEQKAFNMTIPSIRDGVRHEYVDAIKSMSERDIRLSLDRWIHYPVFDNATEVKALIGPTGPINETLWIEHSPETTSSVLNNRISAAALRYELNSDGRLILTYDIEENVSTGNKNLNQYSLYSIPKELGFIEDDYDGSFAITGVYLDQNGGLVCQGVQLSPVNIIDGGEVYSGYSPMYITSYRVEADSNSDNSIDRSAALSQCFYRAFACEDASSINTNFVSSIGIIPCFSYLNAAPRTLTGVFTLNGITESSQALETEVNTMAPAMWSLIQRLFLPVNRFENCYVLNVDHIPYDPLESSFFFGLCGTLASDFSQDVLERLDIYDQLGIDYTEDIFVKESLIFR